MWQLPIAGLGQTSNGKLRELLQLTEDVRTRSAAGRLDTGYTISTATMDVPVEVAAANETAPAAVGENEVQMVELMGDAALGGEFTLRFNDETSRPLSIPVLIAGSRQDATFAAAAVLGALEELSTISKVGVQVLLTTH